MAYILTGRSLVYEVVSFKGCYWLLRVVLYILSGPSGVADWLAYLALDDAAFLLRLPFVKGQVLE